MEGGKVMTGNFNKSYFTKVDIRNISEIKLMSKSAKLLTTHPSSSYALVRDANKQYTLRITNPQIFWSTSKYLVVLVKQLSLSFLKEILHECAALIFQYARCNCRLRMQCIGRIFCIPLFSSLAPYTTRLICAHPSAPAHITQGSTVT